MRRYPFFTFLLCGLLTICVLVTLPAFAVTGYGKENNLEITDSSASLDDVTVTLSTATAQRMAKPDRYEYSFSGTIENHSDEGIMRVIYTFALADDSGDVFFRFSETYDGLDKAIPPHSKISFSHEGVKWGAQSVPHSVSVDISSVKTETELPPARIPQQGEYLFKVYDEKLANIRKEPPVMLSFHVDQGGYGRTATFTKGEALKKAVELFCKIRIGEESRSSVTDNYNGIRLCWEDGTESLINLNLYDLEFEIHSMPHSYHLEHLDDFWDYTSAFLEDDED